MAEAERERQERVSEESLASFAKHFPRREGVSENENQNVVAASSEPAPPSVISALAKLAAEATATADSNWARCDAVRAMLAEDVVYRTIEGQRVCGREAVVEKMCKSVEKIARRFRVRTSDTRGAAKPSPSARGR
jgi:maltooligosyltrehalose synthase